MAVWKSGSVAVWKFGSEEWWQCGSMAVWQCGRVEVWECGGVISLALILILFSLVTVQSCVYSFVLVSFHFNDLKSGLGCSKVS